MLLTKPVVRLGLLALLAFFFSVRAGEPDGAKPYKLEEVILDLRVPTKMPMTLPGYEDRPSLKEMLFVNKKVGWVHDVYGRLGKTTDGGKTWVPGEAKIGGDLFFLNEKVGWTTGPKMGSVGQTLDGGVTWLFADSPDTPWLDHLFFVDGQVGWAHSYSTNGIYRTTDGGKTWKGWLTGATSTLWNLFFLNRGEGWVVSLDGEILHTTDGGIHWEFQQEKMHFSLKAVKFWDAKIGYAVGNTHTIRGKELEGDQGVILYTTNGGKSWKRPESALPIVKEGLRLTDILVISPTECWVVGWPGTVLHTTDAGKHWTTVALGKPPAPAFRSVALVEQDGQQAVLILSGAGGLYRILLDP